MALIICERCGKQVSDTVQKCIHCGQDIKPLTNNMFANIETEEVEKSNDNEENDIKIKYESLRMKEKNALYNEFLSTRKEELRYRTKIELNLLWQTVFKFCAIYALVLLVIMRFFGYLVQSRTVFWIIAGIIICSFVIGVLGVIVVIVQKIKLNNRQKKLVFEKRFEIWLSEEKNIKYTRIFLDKREKENFENLDTTIKL